MNIFQRAIRRVTSSAWEREAAELVAESERQAKSAAVAAATKQASDDKKRYMLMEVELERLREKARGRSSQEAADAIRAAMGSFMPGDVFRSREQGANLRHAIRGVQMERTPIGPGLVQMRSASPLSQYYFGAVVPADVADKSVKNVAWDWEAPQGGVGTPFALIPQVEVKEGLSPYSARGLSYDQGEFDRMYRGHPVAQSAIDRRANLLSRATWEFAPPDVDPTMLRMLGVTADQLKWQSDELNAEFAATGRVQWSQVKRELIHTGGVAGFALAEFGLNPFEAPGFRVRWVEPRIPSTVMSWVLDNRERLVGFSQTLPNGQYAPNTYMPVIDIRKCLWFANRMTGANYEGISDLRSSWTWARVMAEYLQSALLNRQKFGPGVPVVNIQRQDVVTVSTIMAAQRAVENYVNDADAALVSPEGITFDLLQVQPDAALVPVIEMCAKFQREGLDTVLFGMGSGDNAGSRALGEVKSDLHLSALEGFATGPAEAFSRMAKVIIDATSGEQPLYPTMKLRGLTTRSPTETIEIYAGVQKLRADGAPIEMVRAAAKQAGLDPDDVAPIQAGESAAAAPQILPVGSLTAGLQTAQSMLPPGTPLPGGAVSVFLEGSGFNSDQVARILESIGAVAPPAPVAPLVAPAPPAQPTAPADTEAEARRVSLRQVPERYVGIDLTPTSAMREFAALARKVRESKPASERVKPGMVLARMKDIIDGNPLDPTTWRVMAAWFRRHEDDASDWTMQSPAWQAFHALGGSAGRDRANEVVRLLNEADADARAVEAPTMRSACDCGECAPTMNAATPARPRIRSQCRDGSFVTFRALTPREQAVAFNTIESIIAQATQDAVPELEAVRREHRDAFLQAARPILATTFPDPLAITALDVDFTELYAGAIAPHAADAFGAAYGDMQDEIKAVAPNAPNVEQPQRTGAPRLEQVEAAVQIAAQRLNMRALEEFRGLGASVATGAPVSQLSRASTAIGHTTLASVSSAMITAVGAARDLAASEGPRVVWATVSEVMDYMTCPACAAGDGKRYRYPSAEYERAKPPNPRCRSVTTSKGAANLCRGIMVYDYTDTPQRTAERSDLTASGAVTRSASEAGPGWNGDDFGGWFPDPLAVNVVIVVGPPCSGKSTLARSIEAGHDDVEVVSLDELLGLDNGQIWDAARSAAAHTLGVESVANAVNDADLGDVVVYDAPLGTARVRARVYDDIQSAVLTDKRVRYHLVQPEPAYLRQVIVSGEMDHRNAARPTGRRIHPDALHRYADEWQPVTFGETHDVFDLWTFGVADYS